ncbi:hypothetical protein [Salinithrix halophila]|uniref:Uncharacterized protein n=1 Tax=Salinithrix halophila TaxID=1485204 RepID=A0ABV8JCL7_9BACL
MRLFFAILLSLLVPGTGQFVNGQRWKGILFVGLDIICLVLKYTVSLIPMYLLYIVVLVDAVVVGIQIIRGKRETPTGKPYIVEVVVAFLIAVIVTWGVDAGAEKLTMVSLGGVFPDNSISKQEEQKIKQEAETYLNNKYGKEFYVDQIKYTWQISTYSMRGHLRGEKDSDFLVEKEKRNFSDTYYLHKLSKEGREEIKPQVEGSFTSLMNWDSTVTVAEQVEEQFAGQDLSYSEIRQKTDRYQQQVQINISKSLSESNKREEMEKAYQLVDQLNQNKINASLEINYFDPSLKEEKGIDKVDFTEQLRYDDYLTAFLEVDDISQISSVQDLEEYLELVK